MKNSVALCLGFLLLAPTAGCGPKSEAPAPRTSSAESRALTDAAAKAASDNPADALAIAESLNNRQDVSAEDRAAALKAQQEALKKLSDSAAAGDSKAQEAIDKYRASK